MQKGSVMQLVAALGLVAAVLAGFAVWIVLFIRRGLSRLRGWAAENGFQIVSVNRQGMNVGGPFRGWGNTRDRVIFLVRVRDREGKERVGWVRLPIWFGKQAEVRWVE
jgi:hypothetical protein